MSGVIVGGAADASGPGVVCSALVPLGPSTARAEVVCDDDPGEPFSSTGAASSATVVLPLKVSITVCGLVGGGGLLHKNTRRMMIMTLKGRICRSDESLGR